MGDFNAKSGVRNINDNIKCAGPRRIGNRNERGKRQLGFAEENNLKINNSFFQKETN